MITGVGCDIVDVRRIEKLYRKYPDRFARYILAEQEQADYQAASHPVRFLAKRFAAKEAISKALGTGFRNGLSLHDIVVGRDEQGKPTVNFTDYVKQQYPEDIQCHLSVSDEKHYALAYAVVC